MRIGVLGLLLFLGSWFVFQDSSASALSQRAADMFEDRPVRTVLIVGNSRTFYNDMPATLRALASAPESRVQLEVESSTAAGASFETHAHLGRTKRLLAKGWDEVLLQGESASQSSVEQSQLFHAYGLQLARLAKLREGAPTLLVNWPYDPSLFTNADYDRAEHLAYLREVNVRLATDAKLDRLNLAGLWESVRIANPSVQLTDDGNHPTPAGSYLYALAVYKMATGDAVLPLNYVPEGVDHDLAKELRTAVDSYAY